MRSQLSSLQPNSAMSDDEIYRTKSDAWNQPNISDRLFAINNDQIAKLSNKDFETVVRIGNTTYPRKNNAK